MKRDINSRKDIHYIISKFYEFLIKDEDMLPFFKEFIEQKTLETHIDVISNFWEDILFNTTKYSNNVLQKHLASHHKISFTKTHFETWLNYFISVIDNKFEGSNSNLMKNRAQSIATVMQIKMNIYK